MICPKRFMGLGNLGKLYKYQQFMLFTALNDPKFVTLQFAKSRCLIFLTYKTKVTGFI